MSENVDTLRDYVAQHAALDRALLLGPSFAGLVNARIGHLGLSGPEAYLDMVRQSPAEVETLIEGIAVQETWLFRYPQSYELLARWLDERRRGKSSRRRLRMLSVGCATGEEPCSMAIAAARAGWPAEEIYIDAVDRSGRSMSVAQRGRFSLRSIRPELPEWTRRWLAILDESVDIDPVLAGRVRYVHDDVFHWLDAGRCGGWEVEADGEGRRPMAASRPVSVPSESAARYDVIFCRNLLIYLTRVAGVRLLRALAEVLADDGLLFVGHAELWLAPSEILAPLAAAQTFALRRAEPPTAGAHRVVLPERLPDASRPGRDVEGQPTTADFGRGREPPHAVVGTAAACSEAETPAPHRPMEDQGERPRAETPTLAETRRLADRGELAQALTAAETILAEKGPEVELLELLGSLQLALSHLEAARESFRKVIYLDPNHAEALLQLSMISQRLGDDDQAARFRYRAERAHHGTTAS